MADDANDLTIYRNDRDGNVLRVTSTDTGFNLTTTGGANISADEYAQIATFCAGGTNATAFLAKVSARMAR